MRAAFNIHQKPADMTYPLLLLIFFICGLDTIYVSGDSSLKIRLTPVIAPAIFLFLSFQDKLGHTVKSINSQASSVATILSISALTLLLIHTEIFSLDQQSSYKIYALLIFNIGYFFATLHSLRALATPWHIYKVTDVTIKFTFIVVTFQILLSAIGLYDPIKKGSEGWFNLGRPSAFFDDVGWLGIWTLGLTMVHTIIHDKIPSATRKVSATIFYSFGIAILSQSRIQIFLLTMFLFFNYRGKIKNSAIIIALPILFLGTAASTGFLSENLYYDLIDLERNPRLNDYFLVADELDGRKAWLLGMGIGSGELINEAYEWRNMAGTLNVLPLSLLLEVGIIGTIAFIATVLTMFKLTKNQSVKTSLLILIIALVFHNALHKHFLWLLLAQFCWLDWTLTVREKMQNG